MQKLVEGIHRFQSDIFSAREEVFQRLADGQHPQALFITCSDSRVVPTLLTQTEPGDLFVMRNAGNIVPPYGIASGGEAATIEYAISVLKVEDVIVCGHSHCGAMAGLLAPETVAELPAVRDWLGLAEATGRILRENYQHVTDPKARLMAAVEENVLVQIENLRTHPSVLAALSRRALKIHGWVYRFECGEVLSYDPARNEFAKLSNAMSLPADQPVGTTEGLRRQAPL